MNIPNTLKIPCHILTQQGDLEEEHKEIITNEELKINFNITKSASSRN